MATNLMDKGFYQAPIGIEEEGSSLEIEIENPDAVTLSDGSIEITLQPETDVNDEFNANLAEDMDEGQLNELSGELIELVEADIMSRKEWADTFVKGLEVLGMKYEERTEPWNGACGVFSTILTEAAIRFQAESIMETFPAAGPVKTEIIGAIDKFKEDAAERVRDDMNYKLTEEMPEYRPEHERLLYSLGLAGSAFKKIYYDPSLERQVSIFVTAEDLIVPYGASNLNTAERVTHVMRKTKNEMRKLQVSGFYRDIELGEPVFIQTDIEKHKADQQGYKVSDDDRFQILEIHADLVIEGDEDVDEDGDPTGIALPYVVTIERGTGEVLAIRRNWNPEDNKKLKRQHFVDYIYIPGFGFYGMGLIHIIGGYARAGTSIIRQLVDAGTLSNLPGGLKARGMRIKGDDTPIQPGEFRDVDVPSGGIKENVMMLPYKEPSNVLLTLLDRITNEGRRLGSISDMNISDMSANAPVGTTLALLERTLKTMVSLTKGEGFGRPLLEFSLSKKPIITSNWSGHIDFLHPEYNILVSGTLTNVHPSSQVKNMILAESKWFTPNDGEVAEAFRLVYNEYKKCHELSKRQAHYSKTNFSFDKMAEVLDNIFENKIPKQVELKLPSLKKIGTTELPKINLPKLKKVE